MSSFQCYLCGSKKPPAALCLKAITVNQHERASCIVPLLAKGVVVWAIKLAFNGLGSESLIHHVQLLTTTNASVHVQQHSKAASLRSTDREPMQKSNIHKFVITPCACARGNRSCRRHPQKNRQILGVRHPSNSIAQWICRSWRKIGLRMLRIEWHSLQDSQN